MDKIYDVFTVGAGPAGLTAALYCRRAEKSVIIAEKEVAGGQVTHSPKIENYPGSAQMSGLDFAERLVAQVKEHGAELVEDEVTALHRDDNGLWTVSLAGGDKIRARSVIIAAGVHHRTLGLAGEDELEGAGVSYCAVCDGAFYRGMTVAVIGGGNSALQEAVMLSEICKKVYVIQNLDTLTGESALCGILAAAPNVEIITGTVVSELIEDGGELRFVSHPVPRSRPIRAAQRSTGMFSRSTVSLSRSGSSPKTTALRTLRRSMSAVISRLTRAALSETASSSRATAVQRR